MKKNKKIITLNYLSSQVNDLASQMAKGFNQTNENHELLARMVSEGFDKADSRLTSLEDGQEQIKLRLDNVAYRFELTEVKRRVSNLEKKAGVKHP